MRQSLVPWSLVSWSLVRWSLVPWSLVVGSLVATPALAQTPTPKPPPVTDVRPATTTFMGDTGLWDVPTAEILPARKGSASGYRVNFDDNQGFTDVANWPITIGVGVRGRAELCRSFVAGPRIDRDLRRVSLAGA